MRSAARTTGKRRTHFLGLRGIIKTTSTGLAGRTLSIRRKRTMNRIVNVRSGSFRCLWTRSKIRRSRNSCVTQTAICPPAQTHSNWKEWSMVCFSWAQDTSTSEKQAAPSVTDGRITGKDRSQPRGVLREGIALSWFRSTTTLHQKKNVKAWNLGLFVRSGHI